MTADGLEVLLEGLIPEIAYSGEEGESNPYTFGLCLSRAGANPCTDCSYYITAPRDLELGRIPRVC
jgi:hypothetical protein